MNFKDFLNNNNATLIQEYIRGAFAKPNATLNDVYIALGEAAAQEGTDLTSLPLAHFVSAVKKDKTNNVLETSLEVIRNAGKPITAQDIAATTGADVNYTRNRLMEASKKEGTTLLVTYPQQKVAGRPSPHFQVVEPDNE